MPLFLLGFLPKGSQQLACQLLNCLFATDIKGINYLFIKILLLLFLIALGFNLTTLQMYPRTLIQSIRRLYPKILIVNCAYSGCTPGGSRRPSFYSHLDHHTSVIPGCKCRHHT